MRTEMFRLVILVMLMTVICTPLANANYFDTGSIVYTQPNQTTTFSATALGDEFECYFVTSDGYQVCQNSSGWYCYAILDTYGFYTPSQYKVGIDDPTQNGIVLNLQMSQAALDSIEALIDDFEEDLEDCEENLPERDEVDEVTLKVVLVEFSDVSHDENYIYDHFEDLFVGENYEDGNHPDYDPGDPEPNLWLYGSLNEYYKTMSNYMEDDPGTEEVDEGRGTNITFELLNDYDQNGVIEWGVLDRNIDYYQTNWDLEDHLWDSEEISNIDIDLNDDGPDPDNGIYLCIIYAGPSMRRGILRTQAFPGPGFYWTGEKEQHTGDVEVFTGIGAHAHEFGHLRFGWADLYRVSNVGPVGLMGSGDFGGWSNCPAPVNPHYRAVRGWIELVYVDDDMLNLDLGNVYNEIDPTIYRYTLHNGSYAYIDKRDHNDDDFSSEIDIPYESDCSLIIWGMKGWIPCVLTPVLDEAWWFNLYVFRTFGTNQPII